MGGEFEYPCQDAYLLKLPSQAKQELVSMAAKSSLYTSKYL